MVRQNSSSKQWLVGRCLENAMTSGIHYTSFTIYTRYFENNVPDILAHRQNYLTSEHPFLLLRHLDGASEGVYSPLTKSCNNSARGRFIPVFTQLDSGIVWIMAPASLMRKHPM